LGVWKEKPFLVANLNHIRRQKRSRSEKERERVDFKGRIYKIYTSTGSKKRDDKSLKKFCSINRFQWFNKREVHQMA
jgi:hypothetical protein